MKYLIYALGNPGEKYSLTRHNAGRILINYLLEDNAFSKFLKDNQIEVFISKNEFMNDSGKTLKKFIKNKNFDLENLIVMYDDKDFPIGKVRLSNNKSAGGHNGLKDIIDSFGSKDFYRLRIGIAKEGTGVGGVIPPHGKVVRDYVLKNFTKGELKILESKEMKEKILFYLKDIILK